MTIIFDSARLGNPTIYTGRVFGQNVEPTVEEQIARINADFGRLYPTAADDAFNAATSPLNIMDDEADALASIFADAEFFAHYPADPQTWEEADALSGSWGGHPDRIEV